MKRDPAKEEKDHGEATESLLLPKLCNKLNALGLQESSEKNDNFMTSHLKLKNDIRVNNNFVDDPVKEINDKFSNIRIVDEKQRVTSSETSNHVLNEILQNIKCDGNKNDNLKIDIENTTKYSERKLVQVTEKEKSVLSDEPENKVYDVENKKEEENKKKEDKVCDEKENKKEVTDIPSCDKKEKDITIKNETTDEEETKKSDDVLCSRGPDQSEKFHHLYQPYEKSIRSLHCGGKVRIAEPVSTHLNNCQPVNNYQLFANNVVPNYNIIGEPEPCDPPIQKSYLPVSEEVSSSDVYKTAEFVLNMYPEMGPVIDGLMNELGSKDQRCTSDIGKRDEGSPISPSCSFPSSPSSHYDSAHCSNRADSDSGLGSPFHAKEDLRQEDPSLPFDLPLECSKPESIQIWINQSHRANQTSTITILPKPSAKSKFQETLDKEWRIFYWARVQSLSDDEIKAGDWQGDTKLMIAVSNQFPGSSELIYALVERMRRIAGSLAALNEAKHSALYLACRLMPEQPLVSAYIAEALLEQGVDVANLTYDNGLTIPQILQNEGEKHKAVLKELLMLKDNNDKLVFQSYLNDINGNI